MVNEKLDKLGYKLIIEDSELEVRLNPREMQGYVICMKNDDRKFILFPRGTLEDLAKSDRDAGRAIIDNLAQLFFFEGTKINYDSINAIATKAYLKLMEDYQYWKSQQKENDL